MLPKMSPFEDLVWKHIKNRKTHVTAAQLCKYFIVSKYKAWSALKFFEDSNLVEVLKIGKTKYYKPVKKEKAMDGGDNNEVL